jgi:hypothetical protein
MQQLQQREAVADALTCFGMGKEMAMLQLERQTKSEASVVKDTHKLKVGERFGAELPK